MKKLFCLVICMTVFGLSVKAQEKSLSVMVGVDPGIGNLTTKLKLGDEKHQIDYKMGFGVSIDLEKQFHGITSLSELRYDSWKYDDYELCNGNSTYPLPASFDKISSYSFMQYAGRTIFPNKRVQIPLYIGVGLDYINGEPYHNLLFDLGIKARIKCYIVDRVGVFAGADYKIGYGSSERGLPKDTKDPYSLRASRWHAEFGLTVNI